MCTDMCIDMCIDICTEICYRSKGDGSCADPWQWRHNEKGFFECGAECSRCEKGNAPIYRGTSGYSHRGVICIYRAVYEGYNQSPVCGAVYPALYGEEPSMGHWP